MAGNVEPYAKLFKVIGPIAAKTAITGFHGVVRHIIWNGATTDADKAALQEANGEPFWEAEIQITTEGGYRPSDMNFDMSFDGLYCDDLDAGTLLIYYDKLTEG